MNKKTFLKLGILSFVLLVEVVASAFPVADLETSRLHLRKPQTEDAYDIAEIAFDPQVRELTGFFPLMDSQEELELFIEKFLIGKNDHAPYYPFSWVIVDKLDGAVIGLVVFCAYNERHARGEIAYVFNSNYWNKGYATEAIKAVTEYALNQGAQRIYALVDPENRASKGVLRKIGMSYEGLLRSYMVANGKRVDREMHALIATNS